MFLPLHQDFFILFFFTPLFAFPCTCPVNSNSCSPAYDQNYFLLFFSLYHAVASPRRGQELTLDKKHKHQPCLRTAEKPVTGARGPKLNSNFARVFGLTIQLNILRCQMSKNEFSMP